MEEEVKQTQAEQIEEMHEQLPNHLHVLKRLDGKYSVIKEVDADEVEEVATFDDKESAEAYKNGETTEEAKTEETVEDKQVEITDTDGEEPSDPEEVRQFEEELAKTAQR